MKEAFRGAQALHLRSLNSKLVKEKRSLEQDWERDLKQQSGFQIMVRIQNQSRDSVSELSKEKNNEG